MYQYYKHLMPNLVIVRAINIDTKEILSILNRRYWYLINPLEVKMLILYRHLKCINKSIPLSILEENYWYLAKGIDIVSIFGKYFEKWNAILISILKNVSIKSWFYWYSIKTIDTWQKVSILDQYFLAWSSFNMF